MRPQHGTPTTAAGERGPNSPLAQARARRSLTQHQLAEVAGVSRATVARLEGDPESRPTVSTAALLAAALQVAPESIWSDEGQSR